MTQPFYRAFEDRYRGAREVIKQRLRAYAPFLTPLAQQGGAAALDLGCGRGEWLELLGEYGFAARGVDLDDGMLAACRERGLQVETADALAALRACPDGSLALVSAFHLVEHIPFDLVRELASEALRALQPGGLLILETPNPENLVVGASSFYMDPSHLRPIPPNLLAFTAEHAGYRRHTIVRLQEEAALHTDPQLALINVLEGPSPDYSVVAQKTADAATLAAFDSAFATDYGIALGPLALRYEQQHEQRWAQQSIALSQQNQTLAQQAAALSRQSAALEQLAQRLDQAHATLERQAQELGHSGHRLGLLEQRLQAAEQQAEAMGQRVIDLLSSTSWRITAPLRRSVELTRRLRQGGKRRLRALLVRTGQAVLRVPRLKRAARALLRFTPGLQGRLYGMLLQAQSAPPAALLDEGVPGQLSPRAAAIYQQLKKLQEQTRNR